MIQFLVLAFGIDVISLSVLDVICSSILLVCMIRLTSHQPVQLHGLVALFCR
jgi:hypothetical protein